MIIVKPWALFALVVAIGGCGSDPRVADLERRVQELHEHVRAMSAGQDRINMNLIEVDHNLTEAQLNWTCAAEPALCTVTRKLYADLPWRKQ